MKKKICQVFAMLLCLIFLLTGCSKQPASYAPIAPLEFPNLNWGLSIEQVEGVYGKLDLIEKNPTPDETKGYYFSTYSGKGMIFEQPTEFVFSFYESSEHSYLYRVEAKFFEVGDHSANNVFVSETIKPYFAAYEDALAISEADLAEENKKLYVANAEFIGVKYRESNMPMFTLEVNVRDGKMQSGETGKATFLVIDAMIYTMTHITME